MSGILLPYLLHHIYVQLYVCVYLLSPHNQYPSLLVSVVHHTSPDSPLTYTTFPFLIPSCCALCSSLVPILPLPNLHSHSCFHTLPQIPVPLSDVPVFSLVSISCNHSPIPVPFPFAHLLSSLIVSPSTLAAFTPSQTPLLPFIPPVPISFSQSLSHVIISYPIPQFQSHPHLCSLLLLPVLIPCSCLIFPPFHFPSCFLEIIQLTPFLLFF